MGITVSNVGCGRYDEGGTMKIGAWAGKGSGPYHYTAEFGDYDSTTIAGWKAVRDASTSVATFTDELDTQFPSAYTELTGWPAAVQAQVYDVMVHARVNGLGP